MTIRKKSVDANATRSKHSTGTGTGDPKLERSHQENQERAYVAASRRTDRSLEARVHSAQMASEIHKKRTGRGLKVSEDVVRNEEMYEEEEDGLPRAYKHLFDQMDMSHCTLNSRLDSYTKNREAMSEMLAANDERWQDMDIHKQFAKSFPLAAMQARSLWHQQEQLQQQHQQQQQQHQQNQQNQQQQQQQQQQQHQQTWQGSQYPDLNFDDETTPPTPSLASGSTPGTDILMLNPQISDPSFVDPQLTNLDYNNQDLEALDMLQFDESNPLGQTDLGTDEPWDMFLKDDMMLLNNPVNG